MPKYDPKSATRQRITRTEAYAERVRRQFAATVNEIIDLKKRMPTEVGQMYSFDGDTNKVQREVERLLRRLHSAVTISIETGITLEWAQANKECDWLVQSCFSKKLLKSPMFAAWTDRKDIARRAFIERSEKGLNLSDRVWQSCRQLRDEMEIAITVAIGEGGDAGSISRQIRHCLNNPDDMFRRFRYKDEDGNWQRKWKKRVKNDDGTYHWTDYDINDYHTGRGVYRSSAKNAMRVARTETNIAYRRADHERWQKMDFVLGQRVQLSKNHPMHDICDELAGDYPKDFVFDGWHPQCFCFVTPILVDEDEILKSNEAFARGEDYEIQGEQITDYPEGFKNWVRDNKDNIEAARARGTEPYFVRNNPEVVDGILSRVDESKDKYIGQGIVEKVQDKISSKKFRKLKTPKEVVERLSKSLEKNLGYNVEIEYNADYHDLDSLKAQATELERLTRRYKLSQASLSKIVFGYKPNDPNEYGCVDFNGKAPKVLKLTPYYEQLYPNIAMRKSRCEETRMHFAVPTHEFGHLIYQIRGIPNPEFKLFEYQIRAAYDEYRTEFDILSQKREFDKRAEMFIGQYGHRTINDFIAECFQEYTNCRHPSPYAMKVGKLIDSWFRR